MLLFKTTTTYMYILFKAPINMGLACPSEKNHRLRKSKGSLREISSDGNGSLHRHWCFFLLGHSIPILRAALILFWGKFIYIYGSALNWFLSGDGQ
jgi:hypothetical protein